MSKRAKTISKVYFDDEIDYRDEATGDLHLKAGVTRQHYNTHIRPDELESHINYWDLSMRKLDNTIKQVLDLNNETE